MNNLTKIIIGALLLIAVAGYVGFKYGQTTKTFGGRQNQLGAVGALGTSSGARSLRSASNNVGGIISGDIIKKDDQSFTLKLRDGGSKIVWSSSSAEITKMTIAKASDLIIGQGVMVNGPSNSDGSIVAKSIQIR